MRLPQRNAGHQQPPPPPLCLFRDLRTEQIRTRPACETPAHTLSHCKQANSSKRFPELPMNTSVAFHHRQRLFCPSCLFLFGKIAVFSATHQIPASVFSHGFFSFTCKTNKCGEVPAWLFPNSKDSLSRMRIIIDYRSGCWVKGGGGATGWCIYHNTAPGLLIKSDRQGWWSARGGLGAGWWAALDEPAPPGSARLPACMLAAIVCARLGLEKQSFIGKRPSQRRRRRPVMRLAHQPVLSRVIRLPAPPHTAL